jgi:hypothetical protein
VVGRCWISISTPATNGRVGRVELAERLLVGARPHPIDGRFEVLDRLAGVLVGRDLMPVAQRWRNDEY